MLRIFQSQKLEGIFRKINSRFSQRKNVYIHDEQDNMLHVLYPANVISVRTSFKDIIVRQNGNYVTKRVETIIVEYPEKYYELWIDTEGKLNVGIVTYRGEQNE